MDALTFATRTREVLSTLFGSKIVAQLRADLEEARRERDYFRGRCERLELARETDKKPIVIAPRPQRDMSPVGGHKTWKQVQQEHREKIQQQVAEAEKAKQEAKKQAAAKVQ